MNISFGSYALFFISPILGLGNALYRWRENSAKNIICLFTCFYGMAWYQQPGSNTDAVRYADALIEMHVSEISFQTLRSSFYTEGELNYDLYQPLLTFAVSRFTDDVRVLFGIFGLVLGYFYSRVIYFFLENLKNRPGLWELSCIVTLAFALNIGSGINGVRMHTAFFVLLYGVLYYWSTRNQFYLLVAASSVLIHYSFAIPLTLLLATPFAQPFALPLYVVFLASFGLAAIDVGIVRNLVAFLPGGIDLRAGGYLNELNADQEVPRILRINLWLLHLFAAATVTYLFTVWRRYNVPSHFTRMLTFVMLLYTAVNFLSGVGSIGRYYTLCFILLIGYLMLTVNWTIKFDDNTYMGAALLALTLVNTAYNGRMFLGFSSIQLLIGNPVTVWFLNTPEYSLYEYVPPVFRRL